MVGEVFIYQDVEKTQVFYLNIAIFKALIAYTWFTFFQSCLEEAKKKLDDEIKHTTKKMNDIKESMSDLKTYLYGKFGNHINLEAEEE